MKVLFLTNIPTPYRVDFFNELGKKCDLTVLYERNTALDRDTKWESDLAYNYKAIFLKGKKIGKDGAICPSVLKWLIKSEFDIFIVGGYSTPTGMLAIETLKFKKIPFILNIDGGFIKKDTKVNYLIKKHFIKSASWWLSTGKMTNDYLKYYGANKHNIFTYSFTSIKEEEILSQIIEKEEKLKMRLELGLSKKKIALSVGRYIHVKGYDILIDAWKDVNDEWDLVIIGSGEEELNLKKQIKENELENIKLIEFKQKEELLKYYLAADIFILPTRSDVWGLVINEAMSQALPIVTTNKCIAGVELIDEEKNGIIVEVEDREKIVKTINEFFTEDNIQQISRNNLKKIRNYTIENMAKEHIDIFRTILNQNQN